MKIEKHHYFYLFCGFLFLGIISVNLFSDGMFLDGLLYADISRNMANGLGTFWKPHLSNSIFNEFYEHPPLALGFKSIGFKVFGDSIYVERFYSLLTFVIVGYLMVLIWSKFTNDKKTGWIPIILWISISGVTWSASNNMLENTMTIFVCLSVLFFLNSFKKNQFIWLALSGISLSLGLLTKGFFCLYIWVVPFFFWLFKQNKSFLSMLTDTIILVLFTVIPIAILFFFITGANNNMTIYFNKQIIGSIHNVQTVKTRFAIVELFFKNTIFPILLTGGVIITSLKSKTKKQLLKQNIPEFLILLAVVFSGILPIMISIKQRGFYILSVYPLLAIALAYLILPIIQPLIQKIDENKKGFKIFKIATFLVVLVSLGLSIGQKNRVGRDKDMISDTKEIISVVGKNTEINICTKIFSNWSLHGYFSRYGNVSLDTNLNPGYKYYLTEEGYNQDTLQKNYSLVQTNTKKYKLYHLKK